MQGITMGRLKHSTFGFLALLCGIYQLLAKKMDFKNCLPKMFELMAFFIHHFWLKTKMVLQFGDVRYYCEDRKINTPISVAIMKPANSSTKSTEEYAERCC